MDHGFSLTWLRRWWPTLVVATWVAGVTGYLVASTLPARYQGEGQVLVGPSVGDIDTLRASSMLVQVYAHLATSDGVFVPAIRAVDRSMDVNAAREAVQVTGDDVTRIVTIRFEDQDPRRAAAVVASIANQLAAVGSADTSRPEGQVTTIVAPQPPTAPVGPRTALLVMLGAVLGLLGALGLALAIDRLVPIIHEERDATSALLAPVLATIPGGRLARSALPVVTEGAGRSPIGDAYRLLAARMGVTHEGSERWHMAGVRADGSAGEVAANVAVLLASAGRQVAVIDAEPIQAAARLLALEAWEVSRDGPELPAVVTRSGIECHSAVAATALEAVPLVRRLEDEGAVIVIAAPPPAETSDAIGWAALAARSLLVVHRDATRRDDAIVAAESVRLGGSMLAGIVLIDSRQSLPGLRRLRPWREPATGWKPTAVSQRKRRGVAAGTSGLGAGGR